MRLRLSDAVTSAVLAEHYRTQSEMCHQMARMTVSPFKEGWLEFAEEWTKLAREQEERAKPADSEMAAGESFSERKVGSAQPCKRTGGFGKPSKRHSGTQMNWPRGLFRVWVVASVLWAIGYAGYFWHSCSLQSDGDHWCLTGELNDRIEPLRYFGWRQYLYHLGWAFGVPLLVLLIGSATYAALQWIVIGFRSK